MHRFGKLLVAVALSTASLASFAPLGTPPADAATAGSVIINEIGYHPASGDEREVFLELTNTTASAIDVSGWCFVDGITGCFAAGTTIAGEGSLAAAPDAARFTAKYGGTPALVYNGSLSNGGERVRLVDAGSVTIDDLTYGDHDPWPTTPDGTGPSLERIDPLQSGDTPRTPTSAT